MVSALFTKKWYTSFSFTIQESRVSLSFFLKNSLGSVNISKSFGSTKVLDELCLEVKENEFLTLLGQSGCGKTTLLKILGFMDQQTDGDVIFDGVNTNELWKEEHTDIRRRKIGFVFQDFNLLDTFSLKDNIFLPLVLSGKPYDEMAKRLKPLAEKLGITDILSKFPYEVSGGQKQRAAVARALITNPQIVLADEPTGALDSKASDALLKLFGDFNEEGQTILMVTHSTKAASCANRIMFIKDGEVFNQIYRGGMDNDEMFQKISDTLTAMATRGESNE